MHGNVIAQVSTPPGKGGVAVIRMSGAGSFGIAEKVFLPFSNKKITQVNITALANAFRDPVSKVNTADIKTIIPAIRRFFLFFFAIYSAIR